MKVILMLASVFAAAPAFAAPQTNYFFCINSKGLSDAPANVLIKAVPEVGHAVGVFNAGNSEPPRATFTLKLTPAVASDVDVYGPVWKLTFEETTYEHKTAGAKFPDFKSGFVYFVRGGAPANEGKMEAVVFTSNIETVVYNNCQEQKD